MSPKSPWTPKAKLPKVTRRICKQKITITMTMNSQFRVIPSNIFFYYKKFIYLFMQFTAVDEIKDLHHDECVKYKGEMSGVDV